MSSTSSALEKVVARQAARKKKREESWFDLIRRIGDGTEPKPELVEEVLRDCGRSLDDLGKAVTLYQDRTARMRKVQGVPALEEELKAVRAKVAAEDQKLKAAEDAHEEATTPLHWRARDIQEEIRQAGEAHNSLWRDCPYGDLRQRLAETGAALAAALDRRTHLRQKLSEQRTWASNAEQDLRTAGSTAKAIAEDVETYKARVTRLEQEQAENEKEITRLEQEEREIRELMLKP